ncbi:phage major tail tube protein [Enterobacter mori]|uniref:phage major tail tube protein n=1 Tax=Enterobacter mori TaxID=539813 RepID=UPI00398ACDB0
MAVYRGCTLLLNGFQLSDMVAYTPPALRITKKLFRAGNMNAPVSVDTGTEELTATYKVPGMDYSAFLLFGAVPGVKARLTVRRAYRGVMEGVMYLEEQVEGFISDISSDEHGADNRSDVGQVMTVSASYYSVTANGIIPLLEINPLLGLRKIMGINVLSLSDNVVSDIRSLVGEL